MTTKDIAKKIEDISFDRIILSKSTKEPSYKLPYKFMPDQFNQFISNSEAKLHAIVKDNAAKFISGEKVMSLEYEIKMLIKRVYDEGYSDGLKKQQQISEL